MPITSSRGWLWLHRFGVVMVGFGVNYPLVETNDQFLLVVRLRLGFGPFMGSKFVPAARFGWWVFEHQRRV